MSSLLDILYRAASEPYGLAVSGMPSEKLKAALYAARRRAQDETLSSLSLLTSINDPEGEVLIVREHTRATPEITLKETS